MKLYYAKGACSLTVRILVNELNIPCQYESVDLRTKITETKKNFYDINPKGAVPALELEKGFVLTENIAIHQYIADTYKAYNLLPPLGDIKRYEVLSKLVYVSTELHKTIGAYFLPNITEELKENFYKPLLTRKLTYVDEVLAKQPYLAGEDFTLPDAYLFVMLTWTSFLHIDISPYPHLKAYYGKLSQRDSIKKSLKEEGF